MIVDNNLFLHANADETYWGCMWPNILLCFLPSRVPFAFLFADKVLQLSRVETLELRLGSRAGGLEWKADFCRNLQRLWLSVYHSSAVCEAQAGYS